jgi:hypothetical protein
MQVRLWRFFGVRRLKCSPRAILSGYLDYSGSEMEICRDFGMAHADDA